LQAEVFARRASHRRHLNRNATLAKPDLGTKRICPVTGKKFYDLGRDPIVSPYTGQSYPRTYFDPQLKNAKPVEADEEEVEVEETPGAELVPLEEADAGDETKVVAGDEDIDIEDDEDDTFLEPEEDEDDGDVSGLIDGEIEEDEES
jgi:uncharacterized protein (TIGR02300 family)